MTEKDRQEMHTGKEGLFEPLEALDLSKIKSFDDLVKAMSKTAFGGRRVGEATDLLYEMVTDPDCFVVLTLSGAMTMAKMGLIVCEMIDQGMVHAIVSTGALMAHGLVEAEGMTHFKYKFDYQDEELERMGYDRVYDTLELEKNLDDLEDVLRAIFDKFDTKVTLSSHLINKKIGEHLNKKNKGRGILKSAYLKNVQVYIPAFTDSELGLDFALFNRIRKKEGRPLFKFDPFLDLEDFTELILKQKTIGIFTVGGGVPRNWAQQVGPYLDLIRFRIIAGSDAKEYFAKEGDPYNVAYKYAIRICPEPVYLGGLSGCTYSEGISWGKILSPKRGGKYVEVFSDATIAWPIIVKAVMERLQRKEVVIKKNFHQTG